MAKKKEISLKVLKRDYVLVNRYGERFTYSQAFWEILVCGMLIGASMFALMVIWL